MNAAETRTALALTLVAAGCFGLVALFVAAPALGGCAVGALLVAGLCAEGGNVTEGGRK